MHWGTWTEIEWEWSWIEISFALCYVRPRWIFKFLKLLKGFSWITLKCSQYVVFVCQCFTSQAEVGCLEHWWWLALAALCSSGSDGALKPRLRERDERYSLCHSTGMDGERCGVGTGVQCVAGRARVTSDISPPHPCQPPSCGGWHSTTPHTALILSTLSGEILC